MKFFFPDSQDQIDPTFDFIAETRSEVRIRQRDDLYAHEALGSAPYDGILLSKSIVDGLQGAPSRYSFAQRQRFYRDGVRAFFRLGDAEEMTTLGDCGAFTYVRDHVPPYTVDQVIDFYDGGGFDLGISMDHVVLGFIDSEGSLDADMGLPDDWIRRRELTIRLAGEFIERHHARGCAFEPVGAAQGWSPASYAQSVAELQALGFGRVALGGLVPLKTPQILAVLEAVSEVRNPGTELHLLGVTRCDHMGDFAALGVTSFDSTSPLRQAFMDERDNYYLPAGTLTAVRVPQVEGNARVKRLVLAGVVDQQTALAAEAEALRLLRAFGKRRCRLERALDAVDAYDQLLGTKSRRERYAATLSARPWESCSCQVCRACGIEVVIFRGAERNKRRGMHNLHVFSRRLAASGRPVGALR